MSHSPMDEARAWDFGMVDSDVVAFPAKPTMRATGWADDQGHRRPFRGPGADPPGESANTSPVVRIYLGVGILEGRTKLNKDKNWAEWVERIRADPPR